MNELGPARLLAMAAGVTPLVLSFAADATVAVENRAQEYFCASWRIKNRATRELFIEQPGSGIAPSRLRVGIYFVDAVQATSTPAAGVRAFEALRDQRSVLQTLGVTPSFTEGSFSRDDRDLGWSDRELTEFLTGPSAHRDLVWIWDLSQGEPASLRLREVLSALAPVWVALNAIES